MAEGPIGHDRLCEIADDLIERWHSYLDREPVSKSIDLVRVGCLYGLAMNNTKLLDFIAQSHREGVSPLILMPLVRTAYETGITAQWIAQVQDAPNAWINESRRQSAGLVRSLRGSNNDTFRSAADQVERARVAYADLPGPASARTVATSFRQICDEIGVGADGSYQYYKLLCAFTHPSVDVADEYVAQDQTNPTTSLVALREPKFDATDAWLFLAVAATVWAQMSFQYRAKDNILRNFLRSVSRELGIVLDLKPTEKSWLRQNRSRD
ncbi:DUF5677 domain-containing protein [Gordonia sp. HY002]|uniref:DUF5677 domain-containing protein n=1 Tax=Gordonia zhenghanii TaxID=2911516 RepID=UPI001EEFE464|nr:DUF5677 domain-containing protein [Gordonia zhenghanii]MCF8572329.1 DUF5677 domain-containing protein [Gordonia zhenghanii]MCF8607311.1 DUF5677 domain-containing protein [Gordonia zhenghanii]